MKDRIGCFADGKIVPIATERVLAACRVDITTGGNARQLTSCAFNAPQGWTVTEFTHWGDEVSVNNGGLEFSLINAAGNFVSEEKLRSTYEDAAKVALEAADESAVLQANEQYQASLEHFRRWQGSHKTFEARAYAAADGSERGWAKGTAYVKAVCVGQIVGTD